MDVSIILVSYNSKELTLDCLASIYEKTSGFNFDVFVVDNASQDGSPEAIREIFPQVNLIESKENLGFGRASNLAIKESKAKYVFLLNTDTVLINNAIKILFDFMESDQKMGACGGNLFNREMKPVHSYGFFNTPSRYLFRLFGLRYFLKNVKNDAKRDELQEVEQVIGADLMIRKSVLDETGAFDERFFLYCEESELQFRIRKAGYKIFYNPDAKIFHFEGACTRKNKKLRRQMISQSEYLCLSLCYKEVPAIFLKILCSIPQLYRFFYAPGYALKVIKYIYRN